MTKISLRSAALIVFVWSQLCSPPPVVGESRGMQVTPDGKRVMVNKDVGDERWAITRNEDGTVTGNVFRGGSEPSFVVCVPTASPDTYDCSGSDPCRGGPCASTYVALGRVTLPADFFAPPTGITFVLQTTEPVEALQLRVTHAPAKGEFMGSADGASCSTDGAGIFVTNDDDAGTLTLTMADARTLAFPITIQCAFRANQPVGASDFAVRVDEVAQDGVIGDPSVLTVQVLVRP